MNALLPAARYAHVVVLNDDRTSYDLAVQTIRLVFGKTDQEARQIASLTNSLGRCLCGTYPATVAEALSAAALGHAQAAKSALRFEVEPVLGEDSAAVARCSLCDRKSSEVRHLQTGARGYICDGCLIEGARGLSAGLSSQRFHYIYELLDWHFPDCRPERLVTSRRDFPERMRADLQRALEALFSGAEKIVGIHGGQSYEPLGMSVLLERHRQGRTIGPLQYQEVDIGEDQPVSCLKNALWLLAQDEARCAVLLAHRDCQYGQRAGISVEVCGPAGEATSKFAARWFKAIEKAVSEAVSYRGKVLSLETEDRYSGMSASIMVHRLPGVSREEIILPAKTLALIDRNVIGFARQRFALKSVRQSTKKGLLFYGPPGTGKTHTIRYLAASLPGHTTLLITAEEIIHLAEYFALARLLQPAILVIEDADLIARHREDMRVPGEELLLNKLLNEMDGLRPESEVFFILTTNRPEVLEEALSTRPGRIDQAVEFPLPDADGRRKLVQLYGAGLVVDDALCATIVARTAGVSAAFIKELMRRIAQYSIERQRVGTATEDDCSSAIEEMLFSGGRLSRTLLGASDDAGASAS